MIIPKPLKPGDQVAIIAPSSPVKGAKLQVAFDSVKFLGLNPIIFPSCYMKNGYLSGIDESRAKDVNDAFEDSYIKGIFCIRGGYGATRILPLLDLDLIGDNPKFFAGYSDITALHTVFNRLCGFVTYHSPMPSGDYRTLDDFTLGILINTIYDPKTINEIKNPSGKNIKVIQQGCSTGELTGGNLSVMASVLGSPYDIDTQGKILFIEDVGEPLYKIDRKLTALKLAGKFEAASGLILGTFSDIPADDEDFNGNLSLVEIFNEILSTFKMPIVSEFQCGHVYPQTTLPMGMKIKLDATSTNPIISVVK